MKSVIFILLLSLSLSGCLTTEWEDVSDEPEFTMLIGVELISKETLIAHGVTMEPNYEKILDHYLITSLPGIGGPEILSDTILPKGTKFKIKKVIKCVDCFFKEEKIEIWILEGPKLEGAPSRFDYEFFIKNMNKIYTIEST